MRFFLIRPLIGSRPTDVIIAGQTEMSIRKNRLYLLLAGGPCQQQQLSSQEDVAVPQEMVPGCERGAEPAAMAPATTPSPISLEHTLLELNLVLVVAF